MNNLPAWCCASGCRHCTAFRDREVLHPKAQVRRDALRAAGLCINSGPRSRVVHGPVIAGGRCALCVDVHKGSRGKKKQP